MAQIRLTSADLQSLPDDGKRYEIIDGELYVSKAPDVAHQMICWNACTALEMWSRSSGTGVAYSAPGVIFADDDDVIPDVVWISNERLRIALGRAGHLYAAPELVVEVLSPGSSNANRDRKIKLALYSRRGVSEYWIVDWEQRLVELYRRRDLALQLEATLREPEVIESPLLAGFSLPVADLFTHLPNG